MTCTSLTLKGLRCKNRPAGDTLFCYRHKEKSSDPLPIEKRVFDLSGPPKPFQAFRGEIQKIFITDKIKIKLRDVIGDGYCFWRSLSVNLNDNEEKYQDLLEKCLVEKEEESTVSETWVEFWEIPIIAKALKLDIYLLHNVDGTFYVYHSNKLGDIDSRECENVDIKNGCYIFYANNHYQAVVDAEIC